MITVLRKIRKSLIGAGSARKYLLYAIGEITLVVIGILIALQINNWNEWRKDRIIEEKVLREVVENLEINFQRLKTNIERGKIDNEISDLIILTIESKIPYRDTLDKHFPLALNSVDEGSFLSFVGYESLKNVGFEIIENDFLKKKIINLFEVTYKDLRARYDRIEWSSSELRTFKNQHFYRKVSTQSREFAPFDFDQLVEDKQLLSWLLKLKDYRVWISELLYQSKDETQKVLQLIEEELGKS